MSIAQLPETRKSSRVMIGCTLLVLCPLGAMFFFPRPSEETARTKYERLAPGMTLVEAQEALGDRGVDTPPGDMDRAFLHTHSEAYRPDQKGVSQPHYWKYRDGMIVARFDPGGVIVAKIYLRAFGGDFEEIAR
jgi:hypothetical protein